MIVICYDLNYAINDVPTIYYRDAIINYHAIINDHAINDQDVTNYNSTNSFSLGVIIDYTKDILIIDSTFISSGIVIVPTAFIIEMVVVKQEGGLKYY